MRGNAVGSVTIGLSIAAHLRLLPKSLQLFRNRYPKVRLHIIEGFYPTLAPGLQDGSVDFYIGPDPGLKLPSAFQKEVLFSGERAVLCRAKHPLANATSLKELRHAEWITTSITPKAENEIGDLFKRYRLPGPTLALQSQSALTLVTCLTSSDLLAMAPGAMERLADCQSPADDNPGQGAAVRAADHRCHAGRRAAGACRQFPARPHETGCGPPRLNNTSGTCLIWLDVRIGSNRVDLGLSAPCPLLQSAGWGQALSGYPPLQRRCRPRARASLRNRHQAVPSWAH